MCNGVHEPVFVVLVRRVLPGQLFVSAAVKSELNGSVSNELQRHSRVLVVVDRRQHDWVMFACEQQPPPSGVVVVLDDSAQSMTLNDLQIGGDFFFFFFNNNNFLLCSNFGL